MRPPKLMIRLMGRLQAAISRRSGGTRLASFGAAPVLLLTTVYNLRAHPRATVQVGDESIAVNAREAGGDDVARLWPRLVEMYPAYADYRTRTSRRFPVVLLTPR